MNRYDFIRHALGAHREEDGSAIFRVYAPHADEVFLTGDFCAWEEGEMMARSEDGVFWARIAGHRMRDGDFYGYRIRRGGREVLKNDPIAFLSQPHSYGASRFYPFPRGYAWEDGGYLAARRIRMSDAAERAFPMPINVFEVHPGSYREDALTYRALADRLAPYLTRMGYTHVELMPLGEYPYGGSWGYQCMSYFAPSARYGMPEDLMYLVDRLHREGIGVILDWVPAHFPKDEKGLYEFDGTTLYEYADPLRREMPGWGTRCFDLGNDYVRDFLIASALYWIEEYHIDGIRVDAVSAMLYRDYGRPEGQWRAGENGSNVNEDGVSFLRELNEAIKATHPDVMMIAEESSAWDGVTRAVKDGGLGFSFKWNMGWANDSFSYLSIDPLYRRYHHEKLTFSMCYAFHERYLLPISHDEVVYGKRSLFSKMWGDKGLRAATFRTFYAYFMTFPGKKLLFMGSEIGQENEWNWESFVEYGLLADPSHRAIRDYVGAMNRLYLRSSQLWELDHGWDGFCWLLVDERDTNLLAYRRFDRRGREMLCLVCFAGGGVVNVTLPLAGKYRILLSSRERCFGGEVGEIGLVLGDGERVCYRAEAPFAIVAERTCERRDTH